MNNIWKFCLVALLSLGGAAWLHAGDDVEKTILALEQKWIDAELANDSSLSAPLFHEKATFAGRDGKVTGKAEFVAAEKASKFESAALSDARVTVFGDTATVVYVFTAKGTNEGKPFDVRERVTDTWVKMPNGEWQLVASQGTDIK